MSECRGYLGRSVGECVSMLAHFGLCSIDALVLGVQGVDQVGDAALCDVKNSVHSRPLVYLVDGYVGVKNRLQGWYSGSKNRGVDETPVYVPRVGRFRNIDDIEVPVYHADELRASFDKLKKTWSYRSK